MMNIASKKVNLSPKRLNLGLEKDFKNEKPKTRIQEVGLAASQPQTSKTYKAWKEKKKDCHNYNYEQDQRP